MLKPFMDTMVLLKLFGSVIDMEQELPKSLDEDLESLVTRVNGFEYHGDRQANWPRPNDVVDTIKALRADPDLAARLLGFEPHQEWAYRYKGPDKYFTQIIPMSKDEAEETKKEFLEKYSEVDGAEVQILTRGIWYSNWEEVVHSGE